MHSQHGLEGRKPNADEPISEAIAAAVCRMWQFVPGDTQAAPYMAPHLGGFPLVWQNANSEVHHAYAKTSGGKAYAVNCRPTAGWIAAGANGWTVEQSLDGVPAIVRLR